MATVARLILNDLKAPGAADAGAVVDLLPVIAGIRHRQRPVAQRNFCWFGPAIDKTLGGMLTRGRWPPRLLAPLIIGASLCVTTVPACAPELAPPLSPEPTATSRSALSGEIAAPKPAESTVPAWPLPLPVKPASDIPYDNAALAYGRGRKLTQDSRFAEAVTQFTEAVRLTPTYALAFNARAYANIRLKRFGEALADLDQALTLNPSYANAYQNRSVARRHLGNTAGADADLLKAKELLAAHGRLPAPEPSKLIASIWPAEGRVTSGFGRRIDPFSGECAFHDGIDIDAHTGDPVRSTADGVVIHAGVDMGSYGRVVVVDHGSSTQTWYAHLATIDVIVGQHVHRAQVIGAAGNSGRATAPHLHYEVRIDGVPRDPYLYYLSRRDLSPPGHIQNPSLAHRSQRLTVNTAVRCEKQ